jgi:hypothetical protein
MTVLAGQVRFRVLQSWQENLLALPPLALVYALACQHRAQAGGASFTVLNVNCGRDRDAGVPQAFFGGNQIIFRVDQRAVLLAQGMQRHACADAMLLEPSRYPVKDRPAAIVAVGSRWAAGKPRRDHKR